LAALDGGAVVEGGMIVRDALAAYRQQALSTQRRGAATYRSLLGLFEPAMVEDILALTPAVVAALIGRMEVGAPVHAHRARAYAAPFFKWAVENRLTPGNPLALLPTPRAPSPRDRLLSLEELRLIWASLNGLGHPFGPAIGLLVLTGAYREDVAAMKLDELTRYANDRWTWRPGARGTAQDPHIVPLAAPAARLIQASLANRPAGSPYVLSTTGKTPISGWSRVKRRLDGLVHDPDRGSAPLPPWRFNDIRLSFASLAVTELAIDEFVVERCLGRVSRYFSPLDRERAEGAGILPQCRCAFERWADLIATGE
jgi:integrase